MIQTLFPSIQFVQLQYTWLLVGVAVALLLSLYKIVKTKKIITILAPFNKRIGMLLHFSYSKVILKNILIIVGLVALYLALLRPQWGTKDHQISQKGRDLFIALDISKSMLANDCNGSRLHYAKTKIKKLINMLACERVGLVLFSGSAIIQCPLTTDYGAFFLFLDSVDVETIASGATSIEKAITTVLDVYRTMSAKKNKLLVLFTDGEDFSTHLNTVKEQACQEGLHIFAYGVGTTSGAPIPLFDAKGVVVGHQKDRHGNIVISKLNTGALQQLVKAVGGNYVSMSTDNTDIQHIVQYVLSFEKEQFDTHEQKTNIDRYPWFIAIALCCFLIEWIL